MHSSTSVENQPNSEIPHFTVRPAQRTDIGKLLDIENAAFDIDRISRRSFINMLNSSSAILLVAEPQPKANQPENDIAGYALLLFRRGTALSRLYSIAVQNQYKGQGIAKKLLTAIEEASWEADKSIIRLEVSESNQVAQALYKAQGYSIIKHLNDYYAEGRSALRMEKKLRPHSVVVPISMPYYAQSTEFTCGPSCLLMASRYFDTTVDMNPTTELRLWREATTIFMGTGLGGCEPYGMAVALAERNYNVTLHLSETGPLLLQTVINAEKRRVMSIAQEDFISRSERLGIDVGDALMAQSLAPLLDGTHIAICLISGNRMYGNRTPHWIVAYASDNKHIFIHDPWVDNEQFESNTNAMNIPIPFDEFNRMSRYGKNGLRATLLVQGLEGVN